MLQVCLVTWLSWRNSRKAKLLRPWPCHTGGLLASYEPCPCHVDRASLENYILIAPPYSSVSWKTFCSELQRSCKRGSPKWSPSPSFQDHRKGRNRQTNREREIETDSKWEWDNYIQFFIMTNRYPLKGFYSFTQQMFLQLVPWAGTVMGTSETMMPRSSLP